MALGAATYYFYKFEQMSDGPPPIVIAVRTFQDRIKHGRNRLVELASVLGFFVALFVLVYQYDVGWILSTITFSLLIGAMGWVSLWWFNPRGLGATGKAALVLVGACGLGYLGYSRAFNRYIGPRHFEFKYSPTLTACQRLTITRDLNRFADYLDSNGVALPSGEPVIETSTKEGSSAGTDVGKEGRIVISARRPDGPEEPTRAYSAWVVWRAFQRRLFYAGQRFTWQQFSDKGLREEIYRNSWMTPLWIYLINSYSGTLDPDARLPDRDAKLLPAVQALWEMRSQCQPSPGFTDHLVAATVNMFSKDTDLSGTDLRSVKSPDEYFVIRLTEADSAIDSDARQMPLIKRILKKHGIHG